MHHIIDVCFKDFFCFSITLFSRCDLVAVVAESVVGQNLPINQSRPDSGRGLSHYQYESVGNH